MPIAMATATVRSWLKQPSVLILEPGDRFAEIFLQFIEDLGTGGNLTTDAFLAALAIENQAELHSNDMDFSRFRGLRWINPLGKRINRKILSDTGQMVPDQGGPTAALARPWHSQ